VRLSLALFGVDFGESATAEATQTVTQHSLSFTVKIRQSFSSFYVTTKVAI
jgi:hypothetical protein